MSKFMMPKIKQLTSMQTLDEKQINYLLNRSEHFLKTCINKNKVLDTLRGQVIVNLFFEPSTRTRNSFEIAAHRLGAIVLSPNMTQSATKKGELLIDTIHNLQAMGAKLLIIRHADNNLAQFLAAELTSDIAVINAGDGSNEHPTQTLLDLLTIKQHFPSFPELTVSIIGDVAHSRVARSLIIGLRIMGVKNIRIIAPEYFMPSNDDTLYADMFTSIEEGIKDADVVYALRIQKERMSEAQYPNENAFFTEFGLTQERLSQAKSDAIVMHPGPINRGIEIESAVADGPQSVILEQTQNSVAVRMAVIETLLANH